MLFACIDLVETEYASKFPHYSFGFSSRLIDSLSKLTPILIFHKGVLKLLDCYQVALLTIKFPVEEIRSILSRGTHGRQTTRRQIHLTTFVSFQKLWSDTILRP